MTNPHMQQLMSPLLRSVGGTAKVSHLPQSMLHVYDQTYQHTPHVCQRSGSHVNRVHLYAG